jgi:hypothetical protein
VAQVLDGLLERRHAALVAPFLLRLVERQLLARLAPGLVRSEAGLLVLPRELVEVDAQLFVEHLLGRAEAEEAEQAGERPSQCGPSSPRRPEQQPVDRGGHALPASRARAGAGAGPRPSGRR